MKKIIGRGLMARSFENAYFNKDVLILASGVSNSQETRVSEFSRELDLVSSEIISNKDSTVIYFSTCSTDFKNDTPYVLHKLKIEKLLASKCDTYHIFRLPQVVGFVKNQTLISYFVNSIVNNLEINIQSKSSRDLIDVDDVVRIVSYLVNNNACLNSVINIATGNSIPTYDIFSYILNFSGLDVNYFLLDTGEKQKTDSSFLRNNIPNDIIFEDNYWKDVLNKYLPLYFNDQFKE